jgi:hypothetical protein
VKDKTYPYRTTGKVLHILIFAILDTEDEDEDEKTKDSVQKPWKYYRR